uniref:glyoxalase n=1 Tax=Eshraghiella crossota TaxID=45851 RepID=UPI00402A1A8C
PPPPPAHPSPPPHETHPQITAQVFSSEKELKKYIEDEGIDLEGDITDELEVFKLPDGRFLYVEA